MLRQSAETRNEDTTCVSSEFTTLSVVFDSIYESLLPSLPPAAQAAVKQHQKGCSAASGTSPSRRCR